MNDLGLGRELVEITDDAIDKLFKARCVNICNLRSRALRVLGGKLIRLLFRTQHCLAYELQLLLSKVWPKKAY